MGFAYGSLMKSEMLAFVPTVWQYFELELNSSLPDWVPQWLRDMAINEGLSVALDAMCLCFG